MNSNPGCQAKEVKIKLGCAYCPLCAHPNIELYCLCIHCEYMDEFLDCSLKKCAGDPSLRLDKLIEERGKMPKDSTKPIHTVITRYGERHPADVEIK